MDSDTTIIKDDFQPFEPDQVDGWVCRACLRTRSKPGDCHCSGEVLATTLPGRPLPNFVGHFRILPHQQSAADNLTQYGLNAVDLSEDPFIGDLACFWGPDVNCWVWQGQSTNLLSAGTDDRIQLPKEKIRVLHGLVQTGSLVVEFPQRTQINFGRYARLTGMWEPWTASEVFSNLFQSMDSIGSSIKNLAIIIEPESLSDEDKMIARSLASDVRFFHEPEEAWLWMTSLPQPLFMPELPETINGKKIRLVDVGGSLGREFVVDLHCKTAAGALKRRGKRLVSLGLKRKFKSARFYGFTNSPIPDWVVVKDSMNLPVSPLEDVPDWHGMVSTWWMGRKWNLRVGTRRCDQIPTNKTKIQLTVIGVGHSKWQGKKDLLNLISSVSQGFIKPVALLVGPDSDQGILDNLRQIFPDLPEFSSNPEIAVNSLLVAANVARRVENKK